jgi:hypothetical protein
MTNFEQAKKVLQLTENRIKRFGAVDTSTSDEIQRAIFRFQPFQRLVIAHHAQEALTRLREQIAPLENSLEQLIAHSYQTKSCRVSRVCRSIHEQTNLACSQEQRDAFRLGKAPSCPKKGGMSEQLEAEP